MLADPDDFFDDTDNVSFDLDDDAHVNNKSFSYSKKPDRYSSFRLDDDDDADDEPKYEQRAPTPPPAMDHVIEEEVTPTPAPMPVSSFSEPAPARRRREDSDDEDDNRGSERSRFTSERKISLSARTSMSDKVIPDSLDKVTVRTTTGNVGTGINQWKGKVQRRGGRSQQNTSPFGRQSQQPLFSQNNSILHMMRSWDHNGFGGTSYHQQSMNPINRNMMGMNNHNEWYYHTDSFQQHAAPYQSWSSTQGYQNHYSQPVQTYSQQINMSSPNYGFNRNMRSNMSYMQQPSYHSPPAQPAPNVRNRLGPMKRDSSDNMGPTLKVQKMAPPEKHRNLREVDTVSKPEKKEEKKEEEPGVPGEAEPTPPPPPKEVDVKELFPETNDEEMSEYMKKIEEQKRKRAMLVKEKEMKRMREAQIKMEKHNAVQPQPTTEAAAAPDKVEANGTDIKTEVEQKVEEPAASQPEPTAAPEETPKPAVEEKKPAVDEEKKPATEEKKPIDEDVPGTKLVRVKTRDGKIVVRRVALETLSKMKKLSPAQAPEAKETIDPKKTVVLVENLSASTSKEQLFNMGKQVGPVTEAEVDGETKSGRIVFETAQLANAFIAKFQRKMVDLSMITLVLATEDELWPPLPTQLEDIE